MAARAALTALALMACVVAANAGCTQYAQLGQWCEESSGHCCGGAPKNAKCQNYVCTTTYPPAPTPTPTPAPAKPCATFSNLGQSCNTAEGKCCGGGPKNAKCENGVCTTTYPPAPTPTPTPAPAKPCATFSNLGQSCNTAEGKCCGGGPKNAKCENGVCTTTYPPAPTPTPAPAKPCATFSNLGQSCNTAEGKCCGGGPKNAKCENGVCTTTYPSGRRLKA